MLEVREAVDVAVAQLDLALERVAEAREVRRGARLLPGRLAERSGAAGLRGEAGRDADGLLEIAPQLPDQAHVVGVGILLGRPRLERVEQPRRAADRSAARARRPRASRPGRRGRPRRAAASSCSGPRTAASGCARGRPAPRRARAAPPARPARRSPAGARVDGVEQRVHIGQREVRGEVVRGRLARRALQCHVERDEASAGLVVRARAVARGRRLRRRLRELRERRRRGAGDGERPASLRSSSSERPALRPTTAGRRGGDRALPATARAWPAAPARPRPRARRGRRPRGRRRRAAPARRPRPPRGSHGPVPTRPRRPTRSAVARRAPRTRPRHGAGAPAPPRRRSRDGPAGIPGARSRRDPRAVEDSHRRSRPPP